MRDCEFGVPGIAQNRATRKDVWVAATRVGGRFGVCHIRSVATDRLRQRSTVGGSPGAPATESGTLRSNRLMKNPVIEASDTL